MPLYEYYCGDCNTRFELLTSYQSASTGIICQECHSPRVRRLLSVVAKTHKSGSSGESAGSASADWDSADFGGGSCGCGGGSCGCH